MKRVALALALAVCIASCGGGGSTSPTAPTSSATSTRVIGLSGNLAFGSVLVGQVATASMTITNSGNSTLTVSGMTASVAGYTASFTDGAIAAGGSQPVTLFFTPTAAQSYSGTLTVNGNQTSGGNTISVSGTGTGPPVPLFTVAGVLTEVLGGPITAANVRINDGPYTGRSSTTDGNGYYSIAGITGAISLIASKTGYDSTLKFITVSTNTRYDMTMGRTAAPNRTRIGARCVDGTLSDATGSGACSSHGGVSCWRYSDGTCTNP